jgi:hypothetical protein
VSDCEGLAWGGEGLFVDETQKSLKAGRLGDGVCLVPLFTLPCFFFLTLTSATFRNAVELQAEEDDKYLGIADAHRLKQRERQHRIRAQHHLLPPTPELYAFTKL